MTYPNTQKIPILKLLYSRFFSNHPQQTWKNLSKRRTELDRSYPNTLYTLYNLDNLISKHFENIDLKEQYDDQTESERDQIALFVIERYEITSINVGIQAKVLMLFGQRKTSLPAFKRDFQSAEAVYRQCIQLCNKNPQSRDYIYAPALLELGFVLQQRAKTLSQNFWEDYPPAFEIKQECHRVLSEAEFLLLREDDNYVKLYNLACLASIREDEEECKRILSLLEEEGHMSNLQLICRDANFDNVRSKEWFKEFVKKHFASLEEVPQEEASPLALSGLNNSELSDSHLLPNPHSSSPATQLVDGGVSRWTS
jgi:hypothetical protein